MSSRDNTTFYTNDSQENVYRVIYANAVLAAESAERAKQEQGSGKLRKWRPSARVSKPPRTFSIFEGKVYCGETTTDDYLTPTEEGDGATYKLDLNGPRRKQYDEFIEKYKNYTVTFYPDGKYGPTVVYFSSDKALPAVLTAPDHTRLELYDESKYDLVML